ncbi:hypothetical protein COLO4_05058 [Corchorus olitorius]|uniref:Uncharacterized protein n=1 Tax=Corchorus olitorius TaxID=93759 RepID=A0A1R3KS22_9ROSI|nr:hypothetical protein COLO4_05058 [Corchorus olitorius]
MMNKARFFEFQRQEKGSIMGGSQAKDSLLQGQSLFAMVKGEDEDGAMSGELAW